MSNERQTQRALRCAHALPRRPLLGEPQLTMAMMVPLLALAALSDIPRPRVWDDIPNPPWPASYRINAST